MTPTPELWIDSILSRRERVPAFEVIEAEGTWGVLLDDFVPGGEQPRAVVFPREQDARDFVAKVKSGLSAEEAIEIISKGTH
jgi:hypothetical protein